MRRPAIAPGLVAVLLSALPFLATAQSAPAPVTRESNAGAAADLKVTRPAPRYSPAYFQRMLSRARYADEEDDWEDDDGRAALMLYARRTRRWRG